MEPMLASNMPDGMTEQYFINDNRWYCEQKLDGHRLVIKAANNEPHGYNRKGDEVTVPTNIAANFEHRGFSGDKGITLDGELVNGHYYVFDWVIDATFENRRDFLQRLFPIWQPVNITLIDSHSDTKTKTEFIEQCRQAGGEGVIFRNRNGIYESKRSKNVIKHKFVETADVVVTETYRGGKEQAISIGLYLDGKMVDAGGCKVPLGLNEQLRVGDVVECRYLYGTEAYKLYQPVFIGVRTDKDAAECTVDQLKIGQKIVV